MQGIMICSLSLLLLEAPKEEVTQSSRTPVKTHEDDTVSNGLLAFHSTIMYALSGSNLDYTTSRANNMNALKSTAFCSKLEKENAVFQLLVFLQSISLSHPVQVRDVQFTRICNKMDESALTVWTSVFYAQNFICAPTHINTHLYKHTHTTSFIWFRRNPNIIG